ncbi:hypothetical protein AB0N06_38445 [Streptomyces sp. NPDC051020]|uniref:hypothetical protein n=1 Tax=Streptomyces sp. NPDC051020 TaxID=3155409 RepID=UPI00343955F5
MNIQPLLNALDLQEDAARALAEDLRTQIDELQGRLREAETHLEHLAITRKTVTGLADRLPAQTSSPDLPEQGLSGIRCSSSVWPTGSSVG